MASSPIPTSSRCFPEPASVERRHHDRYPAYFNVTLTDLAERETPVTAFISNISQRGAGVMTPVAVNLGPVVKLHIGQAVLFGEVVYSKAEGNYFRTGLRVSQPASGATGASKLLRTMLIDEPGVDLGLQERRSSVIRRAPSRRHLRYSNSGTLCVLWRDRIVNAKIENVSVMGVSTPDENSPFRRSKNPHPKRLPACAGSDVPLCPLSLILGSAARTARSGQGRAGFARRSGPLTARTVMRHA